MALALLHRSCLAAMRCQHLAGSRATALINPAPALGNLPRAFSSRATPEGQPVYLVAGATGSIGSALSRRLLSGRYGIAAAVVLVADHEDKLKQLQQQLQSEAQQQGTKVQVAQADARSPDQVEHVVQQVLKEHGRLDAVASTVGNVVAKSLLATEAKDLQDTMAQNVSTAFNVLKSSVKAMLSMSGGPELPSSDRSSGGSAAEGRPLGGTVVLVSAALASHGLANYEAMSAAKAAVEGLARSAAATYASRGIRINAVAPGLTYSAQTAKFTNQGKVEAASKEMHPLKALAEAEDVAAALEFLMARDASFITGQVLAVDGGLSALHPHHAEEYGV